MISEPDCSHIMGPGSSRSYIQRDGYRRSPRKQPMRTHCELRGTQILITLIVDGGDILESITCPHATEL